MKRAKIEEENRYLLRQQHDFRRAADIVTDALMHFEEVEAIAVIGSVAKPLWKEVPRFREFRNAGIEVWHECKDLDLAVWISSQERLGALRRARDRALREGYESGTGPSTANHQVEIFLIEPGSDRYLGRLCNFNACQKASRSALCPAAERFLSTSASPRSYRTPVYCHPRHMPCCTDEARVDCVQRSTCPEPMMTCRPLSS
jgi:hypothetical protein